MLASYIDQAMKRAIYPEGYGGAVLCVIAATALTILAFFYESRDLFA